MPIDLFFIFYLLLYEFEVIKCGSADSSNAVDSEEELDKLYNYETEGNDLWTKTFSGCAGKSQSPINIDTITSKIIRSPRLFWWNYQLRPMNVTLRNNFHTAEIRAEWLNKDTTPYFWMSTENKNYVLDSIHFHWGTSEEDGSEHLVNNVGFALELHAIHYDQEMGNLVDAVSKSTNERKGLRVVSILFTITESDNPDLEPIVEALKYVMKPGATVSLKPFEIGQLLLEFTDSFALYNGSLTTPPCSEIVSWIVRLTPWNISLRQLEEFRQLKGFGGVSLSGNCRPVQPLNGRSVHHVF